jgi:hypothetical protein
MDYLRTLKHYPGWMKLFCMTGINGPLNDGEALCMSISDHNFLANS